MIDRRKVLIAPSTFAELDPDPMNRLAECGFEVTNNPYRRKLTVTELKELLPGMIGLIAGLEPLNREVLSESNLKAISRCGIGMSNVDLDAANELGIIVKNTPDAPTVAVAELTVGAIIGLLRMIPPMNQDLHNCQWNKQIGIQLEGKKVVIIGFGRIGRYVARLLRPFNVDLVAVDPALEGVVEETAILSLEEALSQADIITLHVGGTSPVLSKQEFLMMKHGVYIMNAARGGVIDEDALIESINNGKIAGAWIDAFQEEPYSGPLIGYPQVILTPHVGSYTRECRKRMEMESVENLISALEEAYRGG